jgi:rubrerythrin
MTTLHETIKTIDDLLSVAAAMARQSVERYRNMAAHLRERGNLALAAKFDMLAAFEDQRGRAVANRARSALGRPPSPTPADWPAAPTVDEHEARAALAGPYPAMAFAVRNGERAFAFYTYVAAAADEPAVASLAEELARDELTQASRLRVLRREAFHQDRPATFKIPESVQELQILVRQWEEGAAEQPADAIAAVRRLGSDFDRLALIGERAKDEMVVAEAQRLAAAIVARLALAGGALTDNPATARSP